MKIIPVPEIGAYQPLCVVRIHVAEGLKTHEAQRRATRRKRLGVPIDQCAARADFFIDGQPTCRSHASHAALHHLLDQQKDTRA